MTTKPNTLRAPAVVPKLEAARAALQDLEAEVGKTALEAAEDVPGAAKRLADLRSKIVAAERDAAELARAHKTALQLDRESVAADAIAMRATQLAAFRKHVAAREKFMATALEHAAGMAKTFQQFQAESEAMVSVLPSGTAFPVMTMGENGLSGNLLGGCDRLLLAEMFRIGATPDKNGRRAVLPFAKPQILQLRDEPDKIPPGLQVLQEAHDAMLREIEGQIARLDSEAMERATAEPKGVAA
jgi:hypothetical protein